MKKLSSLTIFLPAYNEQSNIKKTVKKALEAAKKLAKKYEIIVIDDGSKDETARTVKEIKNKHISLISHAQNKGYGAAIKSGLKNAKMEWVFFTDSDGQFKFDELEKFVKQKNKADLIIGYRKKRQDPLHRIILAQVFLRIWNYLLFGLNVKDVDCAYKLFPRKILNDIDLKTESAITETEFLVRAKKAGYTFHEIPVTHYPREHGKQTGGNFSVISHAVKDSFNLFKDIFDFKKFLPKLSFFLLLALGLFLRLFRIQNTLNFHHDEGRDVLVAAKMLLEKRPVLIGPQTSMGNMYLGPFYYYLIAPFLFLANYNPVGPAIFIAFTGVATVWLIYHYSKKWMGQKLALIASAFYALTPLPVLFTRNSWNPNLAPLISLLAFYFYDKLISTSSKKNLFLNTFLMGAFSGVLLQLHYVALLFTVWVFIALLFIYRKKLKSALKAIASFTLGNLFTLSPFVLFEFRHKFVNTQAAFKFIRSSSQENFRFPPPFPIYLENLEKTLNRFFGGLFGRQFAFADAALTPHLTIVVAILIFSSVFFLKSKNRKKTLSLYLLIIFSLLLSAFYQSSIYTHYLGFLFPLVYIYTTSLLTHTKKLFNILIRVLLVFSFFYSTSSTIKYLSNAKDSNHQIEKTKKTVSAILDKAGNNPYNMIAAGDTTRDSTYLYYLHLSDNPPKNTLQDNIFLICEDRPCTEKDATNDWLFRKGPPHPSLSNYLGHPFYENFDQPLSILSTQHITHGVYLMHLKLDK